MKAWRFENFQKSAILSVIYAEQLHFLAHKFWVDSSSQLDKGNIAQKGGSLLSCSQFFWISHKPHISGQINATWGENEQNCWVNAVPQILTSVEQSNVSHTVEN